MDKKSIEYLKKDNKMANVKSSSISNYFKKIKCTESKDMYLQNGF